MIMNDDWKKNKIPNKKGSKGETKYHRKKNFGKITELE